MGLAKPREEGQTHDRDNCSPPPPNLPALPALPAAAKDRKPFLLDSTTLSSGILLPDHCCDTLGSPWMPNCDTKPLTVRNMARPPSPLKKPLAGWGGHPLHSAQGEGTVSQHAHVVRVACVAGVQSARGGGGDATLNKPLHKLVQTRYALRRPGQLRVHYKRACCVGRHDERSSQQLPLLSGPAAADLWR